MKSHFDKLHVLADEMRVTKQCLVGFKQDARQSRLAMEANVPSDTKTCKCMKGGTAAERVISGDNSSVQVDTDPTRVRHTDSEVCVF